MRYQYLLFDLDGTITDPKVGITTCVQYALEHFGIHEPDNDKLEPFIGPPLQDSFEQFYHRDGRPAENAQGRRLPSCRSVQQTDRVCQKNSGAF